jgi:hypothetical protein
VKSGYRISIAGLLGFVALAAFWFAALQSESAYWTAAAAMILIGALLTSVLGIVCLRGRARAFCIGFALFGFGFTWAIHGQVLVGELQTMLETAFNEFGEKVLPPLPPEPSMPPMPTIPSVPGYSTPVVTTPSLPASPPVFVEEADPALEATTTPISPSPPANMLVPPPSVDTYTIAVIQRQQKLANFSKIGGMSACLFLGLLGGLIASAMAARTHAQAEAAQNPVVAGQGQGGG